MEFLAELILEIILEGIFGLTIENPRVKTRVKTAIFLVFSELVAGFILWIAIDAASIPGALMGVFLAVGFAVGAVWGHKRDWKQP